MSLLSILIQSSTFNLYRYPSVQPVEWIKEGFFFCIEYNLLKWFCYFYILAFP